MAGWRDRAKPVETMSWRARAKPVEVEPEEEDQGALGFDGPLDVAASVAKRLYPPTAIEEGLKDVDYLITGERPTTGDALKAKVAGASFGFADEAIGAAKAVPRAVAGQDFGEAYRQERDVARADLDRASAASPAGFLGGAVGAPLPGPGKATGVVKFLKNVGTGAAAGAAAGAGQSRADLTRGEGAQVAEDSLIGALVAGGATALTSAAGALVGKLKDSLKNAMANARGVALEANRGVVEAQNKSALGEYRNMVQQASRDLEVLEREAAVGVGQEADDARAFLQTQDAADLRAMVVRGKLESAPSRVADAGALKARHEQLAARNVDAEAGKMLEGQLKGAPKAALEAGKSAYQEGMISKGLGVAAALPGMPPGMSPAFQAARGALSSAHGKVKAIDWMQRLLAKPESLGRFAGPLLTAAARGPAALSSAHFVLSTRDEEYRATLEQAAATQSNE